MDLAIWGSYGNVKFPKDFILNRDEDIIESRKRLASFLKEQVKDDFVFEDYAIIEREKALKNKIKQSEHKCVKVKTNKGGIKYYVLNNDSLLGCWEIVNVDTSKLWLFGEYDGSESITYYEVGEENRLFRVRG